MNGTTLSYATLRVGDLPSIPNFDGTTCPGGAAPLATSVPLADAMINLTVFWDVPNDIQVPYGNSSLNVSAGAVKWNIDAAGW